MFRNGYVSLSSSSHRMDMPALASDVTPVVKIWSSSRYRLEREIEEFGRALLEEFIEGREFTCLIAENPDDPNNPITFKPVEFIFPEGKSFKHYNMKWVEYEKMSVAPVKDPQHRKRFARTDCPSVQNHGWQWLCPL